MPKPLSITDAIEPLTIDLWGNKYNSHALTKTESAEADSIREELESADDDDLSAIVKLRARSLALALKPIEDAREDIVELIVEKFEADELAVANLEAIEVELFRRNSPFMRSLS